MLIVMDGIRKLMVVHVVALDHTGTKHQPLVLIVMTTMLTILVIVRVLHLVALAPMKIELFGHSVVLVFVNLANASMMLNIFVYLVIHNID